MVRTRLASVALATGLGLVCGCLNLSERPLFSRFRTVSNGCCEAGCPAENGCCAAGQGPLLEGMPPPPVPPEGVVPVPTVPPRLVPTPAQEMPYIPNGR